MTRDSRWNGRKIWPGTPHPLGANWDGHGVNFSLFSAHAEKVELCLFDSSGCHEQIRISLPEYTDQVWHGYLPDCRPGQLYGYRVYGPYDPRRGHRFNGNKLLIDPYAHAISGRIQWHGALFGYRTDSARKDLSFDRRDSARYMSKAVVTATTFPYPEENRLNTPWDRTIIYETHVVGLSKRNQRVPEYQRGTYLGLVSEPTLQYLQDLGITAIELLPVFPFLDEQHLVEKGLGNYWGYNPYIFSAPNPNYYSSTKSVNGDEFRFMVRRLHEVGIEVILDIVFNHTAEGNHMGPTLSFKGIDNVSYYLTQTDNAQYYVDYTGCGNTLNVLHPRVLQLVTDCLRYWVIEIGIDGFRFDLALSLARTVTGYSSSCPFLTALGQDPVLSKIKLIAESWDLGPGGYQVGHFPPGWSEWNDRFRNTVRGFWRGDYNLASDLATRIAGSSDLFHHDGRRPQASINFVTAHDGFTLHDLVTYNSKHNEVNGESNRDGTDQNLSWNCGSDGETSNQYVVALRLRQKKNMLATLLLSQGVPMLLAGDEIGRSQCGNNNAYCQDNIISWVDWTLSRPEERSLLEFTQLLIRLRKTYVVFRHRTFLTGKVSSPLSHLKDITWLGTDGYEMLQEDWTAPFIRCFGFHLSGPGPESADILPSVRDDTREQAKKQANDHFIILLNAHDELISFRLPSNTYGRRWTLIFDTARESLESEKVFLASSLYPLEARSFVLLVCSQNQESSAYIRLHGRKTNIFPQRRHNQNSVNRCCLRSRRKTWLRVRMQRPKRKRLWTKIKPF